MILPADEYSRKYRVDDHHRIQERRQRHPHSWTQVTELLLSRAVQLPSVHASDAEPGPDLFPGHPLLSRRRPFAAISVDAGQELPLTPWIAPGVCLEPPAALTRLPLWAMTMRHCHIATSVTTSPAMSSGWKASMTRGVSVLCDVRCPGA